MTATPCLSLARALCLLALGAGFVGAAPRAADRALPMQEEVIWMAVSDRALDRMRGGFDLGLGAGLLARFGITRTLEINGDLVTQTTLNFDSGTKLTPAQTAQVSSQVAELGIVQNGPGNVYQPASGGSGLAIVIQNSKDNQHIVNRTVIDATSNAGRMIKNMNTRRTLNDSLARTVGRN